MMRAHLPLLYLLTGLLTGLLPVPMQAAPPAVAQNADTTTVLAADTTALLIPGTIPILDTAGTAVDIAVAAAPQVAAPAPIQDADTTAAGQDADTTAAGQDADTTAAGQDADTTAAGQDADTTAAGQDGGQPEIAALLRGLGREAALLQDQMAQQFELLRGTFTLSRLLVFVLALVLTYLLVRLVMWGLNLLTYWRPGQSGRIRKITPFVRFGLWLAAVWIIVGSLFGGSTVLLIVLVLVLIVVFAYLFFQILLDLLGGLVLLVEQPFVVGSRITIGTHSGRVQRIGLRSFRLLDGDGGAVVVPNRTVLRHAVNSTPPETREGAVTVAVAFPASVDVALAHRLACEAAYVSPYIYAPCPVTAVLHDAPAAPGPHHLHVTAYAFDARYREALASDILRLSTQAFNAQTG